jgi:hypothetical protein
VIRIRLGDSWRRNPETRRLLRELAEGRSRGFSPRDIVGAVCIELEGVDWTQGRFEASLIGSVAFLTRITAGQSPSASLEGLEATLRLANDGEATQIALLDSEGALLAPVIEVESEALQEAARSAAVTLYKALVEIDPRLSQIRLIGSLLTGFADGPASEPEGPATANTAPATGVETVDSLNLTPPDPSQESVRVGDLPMSGLRRVMLRRTWRIETRCREPLLQRFRNQLFVRSKTAVEWLRENGERAWSMTLAHSVLVVDSERAWVVGQDRRRRVAVVDAISGVKASFVETSLQGPLNHAVSLGRATDPAIAVADEGELLILRGNQRKAFAVDDVTALSGTGDALFAAGAEGVVHALNVEGKLAWQASPGFDRIEAIQLDDTGHALLVAGVDSAGYGSAALMDAATGVTRWTKRVVGPPCLVNNRLLIGGRDRRGFVLVGAELETGRELFQLRVLGEGLPSPVVSHDRVYISRTGGGLAAYTLDGVLLYERTSPDPDPSLAPLQPRAALVAGGLIVTQGTRLHLAEAASGRWLGSIESDAYAPSSCTVLDGPLFVAASAEGVVEAWQLRGHLGVVKSDGDL